MTLEETREFVRNNKVSHLIITSQNPEDVKPIAQKAIIANSIMSEILGDVYMIESATPGLDMCIIKAGDLETTWQKEWENKNIFGVTMKVSSFPLF